jgi:hypothetical protein
MLLVRVWKQRRGFLTAQNIQKASPIDARPRKVYQDNNHLLRSLVLADVLVSSGTSVIKEGGG